MGARKFAVMGTLPLGCLPGARNIIGNLFRICEIFSNQAADMFNKKLSAELENLGGTFPGAKFMYIDMYNSLLGLINNPQASGNHMIQQDNSYVYVISKHLICYLIRWRNVGFIDVADGCCCMPTSIIPCLDASRYVFWDVAHPTEKSYKTITPQIIEDMKQKLA